MHTNNIQRRQIRQRNRRDEAQYERGEEEYDSRNAEEPCHCGLSWPGRRQRALLPISASIQLQKNEMCTFCKGGGVEDKGNAVIVSRSIYLFLA